MNRQISELTAATSISESDLMVIQQGVNSRKATLEQLRRVAGGGWALFVNSTNQTEGSAITIPANTRTLLTNDAGAGSITDYVNGSGIVWNDNRHKGTTIGDSYSIRLSFSAKKSTGQATYILIEQDIGTASPNPIAAQEQVMRQDTIGHPLTFNFLVYAMATYATNGARFYITATSEIQIWKKDIFIRKDYSAG